MCGAKVRLFCPFHLGSARSACSLLPPMGEGRDGGSTSQALARAIHDASSRWDGIRYVSRQMNKGFACAIFERSGLLELRA